MKKIISLCIGLILVSHLGFSQKSQVKIGSNPYTLNASAALEVESTTKGFLPPRMTKSQRDGISVSTTTKGLTVYCTDCAPAGLYSYDGSAWSANATTTTNIAAGVLGSVPYQSAAGTTSFLAGNSSSKSQMLTSKGTGTTPAAPFWSDVDAIAVPYSGATGAVDLGAYDLTVNGLTVGKGAGMKLNNTVVGNSSLNVNTSGDMNTAQGKNALNMNETGASNTAQGYYSLQMNKSGSENTAQGDHSLAGIMTGVGNVGIGKSSLETLEGSSNTAVGTNSGKGLTGGDKNIFIGSQTSAMGITTGSNNTIIGSNITGLATDLSNNVILADGQGNIRARHDGTSWNLGDVNSKSVVFSGGTSGTATLAAPAVVGTNTAITLPAATGTLATLAGTETLSNKTLDNSALGTPLSGLLTNATGLPLDNGAGVTGVLPVTNGGTGLSSKIPVFKMVRTGSLSQNYLNSTVAKSYTKILFDTNATSTIVNSGVDIVNSRVRPNVAGYYQVNGSVHIISSGGYRISEFFVTIQKNSEVELTGNPTFTTDSNLYSLRPIVSGLIYLNGTTDYIELAATIRVANPVGIPQYSIYNYDSTNQNYSTYLTGFLVRAD